MMMSRSPCRQQIGSPKEGGHVESEPLLGAHHTIQPAVPSDSTSYLPGGFDEKKPRSPTKDQLIVPPTAMLLPGRAKRIRQSTDDELDFIAMVEPTVRQTLSKARLDGLHRAGTLLRQARPDEDTKQAIVRALICPSISPPDILRQALGPWDFATLESLRRDQMVQLTTSSEGTIQAPKFTRRADQTTASNAASAQSRTNQPKNLVPDYLSNPQQMLSFPQPDRQAPTLLSALWAAEHTQKQLAGQAVACATLTVVAESQIVAAIISGGMPPALLALSACLPVGAILTSATVLGAIIAASRPALSFYRNSCLRTGTRSALQMGALHTSDPILGDNYDCPDPLSLGHGGQTEAARKLFCDLLDRNVITPTSHPACFAVVSVDHLQEVIDQTSLSLTARQQLSATIRHLHRVGPASRQWGYFREQSQRAAEAAARAPADQNLRNKASRLERAVVVAHDLLLQALAEG